jgi:hypothetical protein
MTYQQVLNILIKTFFLANKNIFKQTWVIIKSLIIPFVILILSVSPLIIFGYMIDNGYSWWSLFAISPWIVLLYGFGLQTEYKKIKDKEISL